MKVLVCDDDAHTRLVVRQILANRYGCEVVEAANGLQALEWLATNGFSLVVLDLHMPLLDGAAVVGAVRYSLQLNPPPIVVLTQVEDAAVAQQMMDLGVVSVLRKPATPTALADAFDQIWARFGFSRAL